MAADLLTPLRDYLVAQEVVRVPRVAGDEPPLWLEPRDGVPAPGEGQNETEGGPDVVLGAFRVTGIAPRRHEGFIRIDAVDFWLRSRTPQLAQQTHDLLRDALNDKRGWIMAGLRIEESLMFRDLQRLSSDANGWTYTTEFTFERWA